MYIDTHAHLCDQKLAPRHKQIINNMQNDNLLAIINASYDITSCYINLEYSDRYKNVYTVVGIHPDSAKKYSDNDLNDLEHIIRNNKKVLGIGEIGLDYYYGKEDKNAQMELFRKQLDLAAKLHVPVCLHVRDAYLDAFNILKEYKGQLKKILFHCFSGSKEFLLDVIREFGDSVYFAFGGTSTFKNALSVVNAIESCPLDKIVMETDSPYLTPEPYRGKFDNEPKYVGEVYKRVAEIKNVDVEELEKQVLNNVKNLFGKKFNAQ